MFVQGEESLCKGNSGEKCDKVVVGEGILAGLEKQRQGVF